MKKKWLAAVAAITVAGTGIALLAACNKDDGKEATAHEHTYSSVWAKDDTQHWYAATCGDTDKKLALGDHAWGVPVTTEEATEEKTGTLTYTCAVCGATKTESIDKAGHTYSTDWTADGENHWHASTCAHEEVTGSAEHTFGAWQTVVAATHTVKGVEKRSCTVCNYTETRETETVGNHTYIESRWAADASGHWFAADCGHDLKQDFFTHNYTYVTAQESLTAAEGRYDFNGYHSKKCTGGNTSCNYQVWESHSFAKSTVIQEFGCTQDGITDYECDCGFVKRSITPADHRYYVTWTTDEDYHWHELGCEHAGDPTLINKIAHTYDLGTITEGEDGKVLTRYCTKCNYKSVKLVTGATDFDLSVRVLNNRGTVTGNAVVVDNGEIHIKSGVTMNFDFINIQPADAAESFKESRNDIKVYEVTADGERIELDLSTDPMLTTPDWRTDSQGDVVYFQLKVSDGNSHKIGLETEFAYKEFTVIPDAAAPTIQYSLDNGATWTEYSEAVTVSVGQKVLLTCDYADYSYTCRYRKNPSGTESVTFTEEEPVAGMNKILSFTVAEDAASYPVTVNGMYDLKQSLTFTVAAEE